MANYIDLKLARFSSRQSASTPLARSLACLLAPSAYLVGGSRARSQLSIVRKHLQTIDNHRRDVQHIDQIEAAQQSVLPDIR